MYTVMYPMPRFNAVKAIIISACAARFIYVEHGTPSKVSIFFVIGGKSLYNIVLASAHNTTNHICTCISALPLQPPSLPLVPPPGSSSQSSRLSSL